MTQSTFEKMKAKFRLHMAGTKIGAQTKAAYETGLKMINDTEHALRLEHKDAVHFIGTVFPAQVAHAANQTHTVRRGGGGRRGPVFRAP